MKNKKTLYTLTLVTLLVSLWTGSAIAAEINDPPDRMWVKSIAMSYTGINPYTVKARLQIWDSDNDGTGGANVSANWTLPNGTVVNKTARTNGDGWANFKLIASQTGTYQFCVTNVVRRWYVYDPVQNVVTCNSIIVP